MRANPLIIDTLHGITRPGRAQMDCLLYLVLLASAVFIWWPKHSLTEILERQNPPDALLAALLACGALVAWFSARAGAEEFLLDGQHGLRDWTVGTDLSLATILSGYLCSHLLQSAQLIALSLPIILLAFSVGGGQWPALLVCLAMIACQSMFYRLAAAAIYIAIGEHATLTAISVRAMVVLIYLLSAWIAPIASHVVITTIDLDGGSSTRNFSATSASTQFMVLYMVLGVAMLYVLHRQLSDLRARLTDEDAGQ